MSTKHWTKDPKKVTPKKRQPVLTLERYFARLTAEAEYWTHGSPPHVMPSRRVIR